MGISLSGLASGLDTDTIINELVNAYSIKKNNLVKAQTKLKWKQDAWKALNSKIYSFYAGSLSNMRFSSSYSVKKATSTSNKATVSAGSNAVNGTQKLKVKSLATSGYLTGGVVSKVTDADGNSVKVTGGTALKDMGIAAGSSISVVANGEEKNITVTEDMTVNTFVAALKDAGVNANFDENNQRFFVSSKVSGKEADFSLTADNANGTNALKTLGLLSYSAKDVETYKAAANMDIDAKTAASYAARKTEHTDAETEKKNLEEEVKSLTASNKALESSYKLAQAKADYATAYADKNVVEMSQAETDVQQRIDELNEKETLTDDEKTELESLKVKLQAIKEVNKDFASDTLVTSDRETIRDQYVQAASETLDKLNADKAKLTADEEILADDTGAKLDAYVAQRNSEIDTANAQLESDLRDYYTNQKAEAQKMVSYYDTYSAYSSIASPTAAETQAYNEAKAALGLDGSTATRIPGQDSEIELNGATFTSNTNNYSINGLTISVNGVTADDEEISITTNTDVDGIYDKVKEFFSEYNSLINEMDSLYNADSAKGYEPLTDDEKAEMKDSDVEKWEAKVKGALLRRDSTLDSVSNTLKNAFMKSYEVDGKKYSLSSFGIKTGGYFTTSDNTKSAYHIDGDEDDELTAGNTDKLRAAIASDPETFMSFFTQLTQGVYNELYKKMQSTTLNSAYTVYNDKTMQNEYKEYSKKISEWETKIDAYEQRYRKQFTAMETALAKLQSNTSFITSMLG